MDLLDNQDFFSRLYSLQLISAISTARPERTQECVYTAPLGVSRLVAILDDRREAVRNGTLGDNVTHAAGVNVSAECLLLLTALTPSSPDLQKLVAFENAFERIFAIINAEGSLTHGGITIQDCLSLLANLLRFNASNQSYFRETGWVKNLANLLSESIREQDSPDGVAEWAKVQRDKNVWGLLAVLRLFVLKGGVGTQANQVSFWQSGVLTQVLEIGFRDAFEVPIRAEVSAFWARNDLANRCQALSTAADLIRSNAALQEGFAQLDVMSPRPEEISKVNGHTPEQQTLPAVNVISGLLDLSLGPSSTYAFDVRLSACECLKSYLGGHAAIKLYFLRRAVEGHLSEREEPDNILTILMEASNISRSAEPYRTWVASVLFFHLLFEDPDTKGLAKGVVEGNAEDGEEVITCIQALSANLISSEVKSEDLRVSLGYLMVLCGWLYEDPDAVNDFLGEGSNVQSIAQLVSRTDQSKTLVSGLCAFLLGTIYEFSTKDSPVPRATLHQILTARLGREQYVDKITKLREHPMVRDFEVLHQGAEHSGVAGLPDVYFDRTFMDFLKDNFSRAMRAIDRAPDVEVSVVTNGVQKGVSRELVDSLKAQVDAGAQTQQKLESDLLTLERKLAQEQADHRRAKESAAVELARIKNINEALQRNHEEDTQRLLQEHQRRSSEQQRQHEVAVQSLQSDIHRLKLEGENTAERLRTRNEAEVSDLKSTVARLRNGLEKASKEHVQDLQTAHEDYSTKLSQMEARMQRAEDKSLDAEARTTKLQTDLHAKEDARNTAQTELDDLLMVLADLEEKRSRDKVSRSLAFPVDYC